MTEQQLRVTMCEKAAEMERMGLVAGTSGNISVRIPGTDQVLITPSGVPYGAYTPEKMGVVDLEGRLVRGRLRPSTETPLHTMLHKRLGGELAVVHTHSPYAVTFAVLGMPIPVLGVEGLGFGAEQIPVTDAFAAPGSEELALSVTAALDRQPGAKGVLLRNHGLAAMGGTVSEALDLAASIELTARIYHQALCIGTPHPLTGGQVAKQLQFYRDLKARFEKEHPFEV